MRTLITNDDGVGADGLRHLALAVADLGLDLVVAAPFDDASGSSASLRAVEEQGRPATEPREIDGLEGVPVYGVAGAPGYIAMSAAQGAFGAPPELVLSGINRGPNTGRAVLHSGTVGAALTAATHGCAALAISVVYEEPVQWDTVFQVTRSAVRWLFEAPRPVVLNVNVPNLAPSELRGLRRARLAPFGTVQTVVAEAGSVELALVAAEDEAEGEADSDMALLRDGWATVTPLAALCEAPGVDLAPLTASFGQQEVPASEAG